jgi:hypothetical protein
MLNGNEILKECNLVKNDLILWFMSHGNKIISDSPSPIAATYSKAQIEELSSEIINEISDSATVYWDTNIFMTALNGREIFRGHTISALNPPKQLWIFSKNQVMSLAEPCHDSYGFEYLYVYAQLIITRPDGLQTLSFLVPGAKQLPQWDEKGFGGCLVAGGRQPADAPLETTRFLEIEAASNFLMQPFVDKTTLDRVANFSGAHIQLKRNDAKKIQIVYLRRREQHPTLQDGSSNPVDWSCQWLVQGHWRNQYHPSDQSHKPAFIQSYVKGPEDKPFKPPSPRIFAAVR